MNFGLLKNGTIVVGYLEESFVTSGVFEHLVTGIVWLVRNGRNYVDQSKRIEDPSAQTTSSLRGFIEVVSARSAIGHDAEGRIIIVNVDGKTGTRRGVNLYQMADLLISLGVVNAINLDGGGSVNVVENGTLINYPSDPCPGDRERYSCEREVSTITWYVNN